MEGVQLPTSTSDKELLINPSNLNQWSEYGDLFYQYLKR